MFDSLRKAFSNVAQSLGEKELNEKDIKDILFELEISLLESDVAGEVIDSIKSDLKEKLIGSKVDKNEIENIPISQIANKTYAIRKIDFDKNKNALIAIDRLGLFVLNDNYEIVNSFSHSADNQNSISQNSIYEIFVDDSNAYWLGVREGGINIVNDKENIFTNIQHVRNVTNSIQNNNIRSIYESESGEVWFGTENGLSKYDKNNNWTNYNKDPKLFNTAVLTVNEYKNKLILGTYGEGVLAINQSNGKVSSLELASKKPSKFIFRIRAYKFR